MLREHARAIERGIAAIDLLLVLVSLVAANAIVGKYSFPVLLDKFGFFILISSFIWFLLLRYAGFYRSIRLQKYHSIVMKVLQTIVLGVVVNAALLFISAPSFSRAVFVVHVAIVLFVLLSWKLLIRLIQRRVRRRGYNYRRIVVVGTKDGAIRFIRHVEEHKDWGFRIVGCVQGVKGPLKKTCSGYPVLGRLDSLVDICKGQPVDEVIFTLPTDYLVQMEEILPRLETMGVTFRLALDYYRPKKSRMFVGALGDQDPVPVVTYHRVTLDPTQLFLKRLLDVIGGVAGLLITGLILPFVWLAMRWESPGPLFFKQIRVGQNGRNFKCYKFRSMHVDAEQRKKELMAENEMKGAIFKMKDDPRITRVGKFLRKTSLDELPQFWNVLKGEMSLVGTRPPTPDEVEQYEEWHRGRIAMKPGLTGVWQTSGRNKIDDFDKICQLDMSYIDNWSVWLDLKLLAKTVAVVMLGVGAR